MTLEQLRGKYIGHKVDLDYFDTGDYDDIPAADEVIFAITDRNHNFTKYFMKIETNDEGIIESIGELTAQRLTGNAPLCANFRPHEIDECDYDEIDSRLERCIGISIRGVAF